MRRTGRVLILLFALASPACAKRDWTETLTLVDVTGTWDGSVFFRVTANERHVKLILRQRGASVTGEVAGPSLFFGGDKVEGVINGELFTFKLGALRGEASVSGDDLDGRAEGGTQNATCPCTISLHRAGPADTKREVR
jgi:hypothetical protein